MTRLRAGIDVAPTDRWFIERTVWLIAGVVLLLSTLLATLAHPNWILLVSGTGLVSICVAVTGYCPVGNVLRRLGLDAALANPAESRWGLYRVQTDAWYLERRIYMMVGINVNVDSCLLLAHSPWWGLFTGFVGVAMVWFASTGYCTLANVFYWIGAEPRLTTLPAPQQQTAAADSHRGDAIPTLPETADDSWAR